MFPDVWSEPRICGLRVTRINEASRLASLSGNLTKRQKDRLIVLRSSSYNGGLVGLGSTLPASHPSLHDPTNEQYVPCIDYAT